MSGAAGAHGDRLDPVDIAKVIEILRASGWREAYLRMGDFELRLSDTPDGGAAPAAASAAAPAPASVPAPAPGPPTAPDATDAAADTADAPPATDGAPDPPPVTDAPGHVVVRAESLGVFWRSPQPGAPPFVEVGDEVEEDTPLAIVEVMKMMTRVVPRCRGRVAAIHVGNGDVVEFGQPLVTIATT